MEEVKRKGGGGQKEKVEEGKKKRWRSLLQNDLLSHILDMECSKG